MESNLLQALKADLQDAGIVAARSLFFTPHGTFVPSGVVMPAIGIKDGRTKDLEGASMTLEPAIQVELIGWVNMAADGEEALVGDDGVLPLMESIKARLRGNRLGLSEVQFCNIISTAPSVLFFTRNQQWLVKKSLLVEYELEYDR